MKSKSILRFVFLPASLLLLPGILPAFQNTNSLVLRVTVSDKQGFPINGLGAENFSVSVDDQPQKILSLSAQDSPASVGFLIDVSGSQPINKTTTAVVPRDPCRQGIARFLDLSHRENEYFLMTFNSEVQLRQDWTSDPQAILQKVDSLTFNKRTSLNDAVQMGIKKVTIGRNSKRVLVLITNGLDTNSRSEFVDARDLLRESDVVLYAVGILPVQPRDWSLPIETQAVLDELSEGSGGRSHYVTTADSSRVFKEIFELIALEVRAQYQLAIAAPSSTGGKAKWHKVKIKVTRINPKGKLEQLQARTRQTYPN
jgi:Ca-activated chloride channel homolog